MILIKKDTVVKCQSLFQPWAKKLGALLHHDVSNANKPRIRFSSKMLPLLYDINNAIDKMTSTQACGVEDETEMQLALMYCAVTDIFAILNKAKLDLGRKFDQIEDNAFVWLDVFLRSRTELVESALQIDVGSGSLLTQAFTLQLEKIVELFFRYGAQPKDIDVPNGPVANALFKHNSPKYIARFWNPEHKSSYFPHASLYRSPQVMIYWRLHNIVLSEPLRLKIHFMIATSLLVQAEAISPYYSELRQYYNQRASLLLPRLPTGSPNVQKLDSREVHSLIDAKLPIAIIFSFLKPSLRQYEAKVAQHVGDYFMQAPEMVANIHAVIGELQRQNKLDHLEQVFGGSHLGRVAQALWQISNAQAPAQQAPIVASPGPI